MRDLIVEFVREVLAEKKKRRRKPGGPRTDMGAVRQLNPGEFMVRVKGAVDTANGDVDAAARSLEVSPRTLYHYLDTEPTLANVKTSEEREGEDKKYGRRKSGD